MSALKLPMNGCCSYCGYPFKAGTAWPRTCSRCENTTWLNPTPVTVLLVPTETGLIGVRRSIEPGYGKLALPGGYVDRFKHKTDGGEDSEEQQFARGVETWREAGSRELFEEANIVVASSDIRFVDLVSAPNGILLVYGMTPMYKNSELPPFTLNNEVSERVILTGIEELAFPIHTAMLRRYFACKPW